MVLNMGNFEVSYLEAINYGLQAAPSIRIQTKTLQTSLMTRGVRGEVSRQDTSDSSNLRIDLV